MEANPIGGTQAVFNAECFVLSMILIVNLSGDFYFLLPQFWQCS